MASETTRSERVEARTTQDVLAVVKRAAEMQGRSVSDFVMSAAADAARRTIEDTHVVRLAADDQVRFIEALQAAPAPAPAMMRAFEHRTNLTGDV